jgi:hypothetical protein
LRPVLAEHLLHGGPVLDAGMDIRVGRVIKRPGQASVLEMDIVVIIQIVDPDNFVTTFQQS